MCKSGEGMKKELLLLSEELLAYDDDTINTVVNILFMQRYSDSTNRKFCCIFLGGMSMMFLNI